ncbi:TOBE domain-containing protein [Arachnia propionica]|uniref:TOBE domain-containing protein n=1 Tax=Arachnia propionica TaxID=1750 RepID=UPI0030D3B8D6
MRISARNQLRGTVVSIEQGVVNGIVQIEVAPGLVISSSITNEAIRDLGLTVGGKAVAVIKSSSVMVGVQD